MENNAPSMFVTFLPLIFMSLLMAVSAHLLAKDKGRNVVLWTVLALVPIVNFACIWYFIGASNLKLERKLDALMTQLNGTSINS
jgi:O-antigen/teichoic acid export membrane protein